MSLSPALFKLIRAANLKYEASEVDEYAFEQFMNFRQMIKSTLAAHSSGILPADEAATVLIVAMDGYWGATD